MGNPKMLYFAYGSNLSASQMQERCPESRVYGPGQLPNYRLDFNRFSQQWRCGVADVVPIEGAEVWGLVYEISETDLEALDQYEGYPTAYNRIQVAVHTTGEILQDVWVYIVQKKGTFVSPTAAYLNIIQEAAEKYKFPNDYREALDQVPLQRGIEPT